MNIILIKELYLKAVLLIHKLCKLYNEQMHLKMNL